MDDLIKLIKLQNQWTTSAYDDLIKSKIASCQHELLSLGIAAASDLGDPLIREAVLVYCSMTMGKPEPAEYDRLKMAFDEIRGSLQLKSGYGLEVTGNA